MQVIKTGMDTAVETYILLKETQQIGVCKLRTGAQNVIETFEVDSIFAHKGYGTYLLKQVLRQSGGYDGAVHTVVPRTQVHRAFFEKNGFAGEEEMRRHVIKQVVPLDVVHHLLQLHISPGDFVIDATAGLGRDAAFLCQLVGDGGKVLALDIQPQAVQATNNLLADKGLSHIGHAVCENHANLGNLVPADSVDAIVFNFGYLPGGDHNVFSTANTSVQAVSEALNLVKVGGVVVLCLYCGGPNGDSEKMALMSFVQALPDDAYTVIACNFSNRRETSPLPILIKKDR